MKATTLCNQRAVLWSRLRGCPVLDLKLLLLTWLPLTSVPSLNKGRKDTERREDTWRSPDAPWMPEEVPYKVEHIRKRNTIKHLR